MGKALAPSAKLQAFARVASERLKRQRSAQLSSSLPARAADAANRITGASASDLERRRMEAAPSHRERLPLSEVVADCARRWFEETLREAKKGDPAMQVLVGQMYYSGYGVSKSDQKGKAWINRAARCRSSVWKVSNKHPGYNASDSDSDELDDKAK